MQTFYIIACLCSLAEWFQCYFLEFSISKVNSIDQNSKDGSLVVKQVEGEVGIFPYSHIPVMALRREIFCLQGFQT